MTKKYIFVLVILLGIISCKKNKPISDSYHPKNTAKQLREKLDFAFNQKTPDSLEQFFIEWNNQIGPNTAEFINQNDTINAIYKIYKTFYRPFDLMKLGNWEWGNDLNSGCKYVVIQNQIYFTILKDDDFQTPYSSKRTIDSINHFRPFVDLDRTKILYFESEYDKSVSEFLYYEITKFKKNHEKGMMAPKIDKDKRYLALRPYIPILPMHSCFGYYIITHPQIDLITLNKSLTKAIINFQGGYQGGETTLERTGNNWLIKNSKATWIE